MLKSNDIPQANKLNLIHMVAKDVNVELSDRKFNYYRNAVRMLGMSKDELRQCDADPKAQRELYMAAIERSNVVATLLNHFKFKRAVHLLRFSKNDIAKVLMRYCADISEVTAERRALCVLRWIKQARDGF